MADSEKAVRWEKDGNIATVWLCNPKKRNAMGPALWEQLPQVFSELAEDEEVWAVALCAEGPAFTVGLDLKSMGSTIGGGGGKKRSQLNMKETFLADVRRLQAAITAVADYPQPVVAALHGYCIGGGIDLVTACDVRLASKAVVLSIREARMAMVADVGTLQRLPRILSKGQVAELAFTGKDFDADYAKQIGLVNEVYDTPEATQKAAQDLAREMAKNPPQVLRGIKQVLAFGEDHSVKDGLEYVAVWNSAFLTSDDLTEAMMAFMQKREPNFKGR